MRPPPSSILLGGAKGTGHLPALKPTPPPQTWPNKWKAELSYDPRVASRRFVDTVCRRKPLWGHSMLRPIRANYLRDSALEYIGPKMAASQTSAISWNRH